jgi:hypothetical protein
MGASSNGSSDGGVLLFEAIVGSGGRCRRTKAELGRIAADSRATQEPKRPTDAAQNPKGGVIGGSTNLVKTNRAQF